MKTSGRKIFCILSLIVLLMASRTTTVTAGEIDWEMLQFGINLQRIFPYGDFGSNWNDAFGYGVIAQYELQNMIYLKTSGSISYFTPSKDSAGNQIPFIYLINLTGGMSMIFPNTKRLYTTLGAGIDNYTFIFRGEAAEKVAANYIESEIGLHAEAGLGYESGILPEIQISLRYGIIFSLPDLLHLIRANLVFYY
jgi:hypothetical protein